MPADLRSTGLSVNKSKAKLHQYAPNGFHLENLLTDATLSLPSFYKTLDRKGLKDDQACVGFLDAPWQILCACVEGWAGDRNKCYRSVNYAGAKTVYYSADFDTHCAANSTGAGYSVFNTKFAGRSARAFQYQPDCTSVIGPGRIAVSTADTR